MFRALLFGLPALIILRIVARQGPARAPSRYRQSA